MISTAPSARQVGVDALTADHQLDASDADTALLDPDFLASALPIAIDWLIERVRSDAARAAARAIRRVLPRLVDAEPAERLAYLLFAARTADAPELAATIEASGRAPAWSTEWAKWRPTLPTRPLHGVFDPPRAVTIGRLLGRGVVAAVFAPGGQPGKRALGAWAVANGDEVGDYRQVRLDTAEGLRCLALGDAAREVIVLGYDDGSVHLLDASARTVRSRLTAHRGPVVAVGLLVAGDRAVVLSAGDDGDVRVSDFASGASLRTIETGTVVCSAVFGTVDDRPVAVTGARDGTVRSWDPVTGRPIAPPATGHDGPVTAVAFGTVAGSSVVVSGGADGTVRIWDAVTGAPTGDPLAAHAGAVTALACVAVDGCPTTVSGGADRTVRFWNPAAPPVEAYRLYAPGPVDALAAGVHSGRSVLVVAARSTRPVCYDLADGFPVPGPPHPDRGPVNALATGAVAGRPVVAAGGGTAAFDAPAAGGDAPFARNGVADVLDLATGAFVASVAGHEREVGAVALGRAGPSTVLATAGAGTIRMWDAATGAATAGPLTDIPDAGKRQRWHARLLVFGGDAGHQVLIADGTTRIVRVDENTGERIRTDPIAFGFWSGIDGRPLGATTVVGPRTDVSALASGEINGHIAYGMGHRNGTVVVFFDGGVPAGQPPLELPPVEEYELRKAVTAIGFGVAAERALLAVARCGRVDLVDCTTGVPAGSLVGHRGDVRAVAFGRAGDRSVIVTGGADRTVRLWDPAEQRAAADGTVRPAQIRSIHVGVRVNALACPGGGSRVAVGTDWGIVAIRLDA